MTALAHPNQARGAAPALAALTLLWLVGTLLAMGSGRGAGTRVEEAGLSVFQLEAGAVSRLRSHAVVHPGDLVQIAYDARGPHGVIWSEDERGVRSLHFPSRADAPTALAEGRSVPLPFSWELDDALGDERFYFVTSRWPLDPARVMARGAGRPAFTLHKRPRPEASAPSVARLR